MLITPHMQDECLHYTVYNAPLDQGYRRITREALSRDSESKTVPKAVKSLRCHGSSVTADSPRRRQPTAGGSPNQ
jgi:hypothetical protein